MPPFAKARKTQDHEGIRMRSESDRVDSAGGLIARAARQNDDDVPEFTRNVALEAAYFRARAGNPRRAVGIAQTAGPRRMSGASGSATMR